MDIHEEIDQFIAEEADRRARIFPYTVRQLAAKFGMSKSAIHKHLNASPILRAEGHRWVYRSDEEKESAE